MTSYQNNTRILQEVLFSDDINLIRGVEKNPAIIAAIDNTDIALAASNVPAQPLTNRFLQAANYKGTVFLAIQHLQQAMSGATIGLEKKTSTLKGKVAQGGAKSTDEGYEPFYDHPLYDILQVPNPADTFSDFICQCILNWNLHGEVMVWGRPNNVGAPIRYYCLPLPLMVPAYGANLNQDYPLGAWMINQYYPGTNIMGIIPTGLAPISGAYIDARDVYRMKNPHPIWRWAGYGALSGGDSEIDIKQNVDLSFWSIMSQGVKPAGFIDAPGADEDALKAIQNKIDQNHGGARKHGKPIVLGGGHPERPALKWNPISPFIQESLHEGAWEIYTSFVLALFGLDMAGVGLKRQGGHAERWAARKDERETLTSFLSKLAALLTSGGLVKQWGLLKKGVRVIISLREDVGYDPSEMSRDMSADSSGTFNEVRNLRGYKAAGGIMEREVEGMMIGDYPYSIAMQLAQKELGLDKVGVEEELFDLEQEKTAEIEGGTADETSSTDTQGNTKGDNPPVHPHNSSIKTPEDNGSLGGKGSGAEWVVGKAMEEIDGEDILQRLVQKTLTAPILSPEIP